jgi:THO complex subunit 4
MIDKLELSLDDIIKQNKKPSFRRGGGRGGNRGGNRRPAGPVRNQKPGGGIRKGRGAGGIAKSKYVRGDVNQAWKHDMFEGGRKRGLALGTTKLMVSNLDYGVSDSDINELFAEFGPLKQAAVHYDRSGRSLGTADVVFERKADALKALKQYNGVPLDGRPMNIQIVTSEVPAPRSPISKKPSRLGGGGGNRMQRGGGGGGMRGGNRRPGRGAGGSGGGAGRRNTKSTPTLEELDAELDAYTKDM